MTTIIGRYFIETGYGFDICNCTLTEIEGVDEFGRYIFGSVIFRGTWNECLKQAEEWYESEMKDVEDHLVELAR